MSEQTNNPDPELSFTPKDLHLVGNMTDELKRVRRSYDDPIDKRSNLYLSVGRYVDMVSDRSHAGEPTDGIRTLVLAIAAGAMTSPDDSLGAAHGVRSSEVLTTDEKDVFLALANQTVQYRAAGMPETTVTGRMGEMVSHAIGIHKQRAEIPDSDATAFEVMVRGFYAGIALEEPTMKPQDDLADAMQKHIQV